MVRLISPSGVGLPHIALIASLALLQACGGGDSSTSTVTLPVSATPTPTPAPTPTPTPTAAEIVAQATTIDLDNLLNYANPTLPAYYDNTVSGRDNEPVNNQLEDRIATLGRVLFYDAQLSVNNTKSCASCHQQSAGFDDPEQFSEGFAGATFTTAHAMRLGNARYFSPGAAFWDKRAASLEEQATEPIKNPIEMGWDAAAGGIGALITRMEGLDYYPALFEFAFGNATITEARMQQALAQFERAMISSDSRWDQAYAQVFNPNGPNRNLNVALPGFNVSENRGRQLFMTGRNNGGAGCSACHQPPTYALAANSRSNGLDAGETVLFKSPSLKSVGLSSFFMHDGRFNSLAQVVEHYNSGIQNGPALDNRLRQGANPQRLNLSDADKAALVDFMESLNDTSLTVDVRFTNPFR